MTKVKLTILNVGVLTDPELKRLYKDYCCIFSNAFRKSLGKRCELSINCHKIKRGRFPKELSATDVWVITGSKNSVFDNEDWIEKLTSLLRDLYDKDGLLIGFCFGHQIMAKALGGKVERFAGGWGLGAHSYEAISGKHNNIMFKPNVIFPVCHQDQVVTKPKGADVIMSSEFCENAAFIYPNGSLSVQFHPEFTHDFISRLTENKILDKEISEEDYKVAKASLTGIGAPSKLDNDYFFDKLSDYILSEISRREKLLDQRAS